MLSGKRENSHLHWRFRPHSLMNLARRRWRVMEVQELTESDNEDIAWLLSGDEEREQC